MGVFIKNYSKAELIKRLFYDLKTERVGLLAELYMVDLTTDVLLDKEEAYQKGFNRGFIEGYKEANHEKEI